MPQERPFLSNATIAGQLAAEAETAALPTMQLHVIPRVRDRRLHYILQMIHGDLPRKYCVQDFADAVLLSTRQAPLISAGTEHFALPVFAEPANGAGARTVGDDSLAGENHCRTDRRAGRE